MKTILILAPDAVHAPRGEGPLTDRAGDLFDTGFVETVRTLSAPRPNLKVLVPWTHDLAPLLSAATLDGAPAFDPERPANPESAATVIVPYAVDEGAQSLIESAFWASSHLSLHFERPVELHGYLKENRVDHIIALGFPQKALGLNDTLRYSIKEHAPQIFVFGRILSPGVAADVLGRGVDGVIDLTARYEWESPPRDSDAFKETDSLLEWESHLEPYIPFGLLIQRAIFSELDSLEPKAGAG
jgi:hypothetical protein